MENEKLNESITAMVKRSVNIHGELHLNKDLTKYLLEMIDVLERSHDQYGKLLNELKSVTLLEEALKESPEEFANNFLESK